VVEDLIDMGRWHPGDGDILIVFDTGCHAPRMAHLLEGPPVELLGRMRTVTRSDHEEQAQRSLSCTDCPPRLGLPVSGAVSYECGMPTGGGATNGW
jgi:hypothetical protein